jgi:hypothetical protein
MIDNCEILRWDYFLTIHERDFLHLATEDAMPKYPNLGPQQIDFDLIQLVENTGLSIDKFKELMETTKKQR